jgi:phage anti-repressor protein
MTNKCNLCNKSFIFKSKLNEHKNRKNPCNKQKESTKCELCSIEFPCLAKLEKHKKSKKHITIENQYINDNSINVENQYNIDNKFILKPLFDKIIDSKSLNNINLDLIVKAYYQLLTIQELLFVINYSINKLYIDKFWNSIEDDKWIYLDNDLIEWFEYKEISKDKELILRLLNKNFEIAEDFNIYNNENLPEDFNSPLEGELKFGSATKHIVLSSDCFKELCLFVNTKKSKEIKHYFLELEKIFKFYNKYILKYNQIKLEKTKLIKNTYIDKSLIRSKEWLYLVSNQAKARENIFKFGFTTSKQTRLSTYNTGTVEADRLFYCELYECYNAKSLEKRVENLLKNFKIPNESEMYQLNFNAFDMLLKTICTNDNNSVNSINSFLINDYDKYLSLEPIEFKFEEK